MGGRKEGKEGEVKRGVECIEVGCGGGVEGVEWRGPERRCKTFEEVGEGWLKRGCAGRLTGLFEEGI